MGRVIFWRRMTQKMTLKTATEVHPPVLLVVDRGSKLRRFNKINVEI